MDPSALRRLRRELVEVRKRDNFFGRLWPMGGDLSRLLGEVRGPPGSPYEGGRFRICLRLKRDHPASPPRVRFLTKIWHPNIELATGKVCLNVLAEDWVADMSLRVILLSLQGLLVSPEAEDPFEVRAARQLLTNPAHFERTARLWTAEFGRGPPFRDQEVSARLARLVAGGMSREEALLNLSLE